MRRKAATKNQAADIRDDLLRDLEATSNRAAVHNRATFRDLCVLFRKQYAVPPEYVNDRKIHGQRAYRSTLSCVKVLEDHFGSLPVASITYSDCHALKLERLRTPIVIKPKKKGEKPIERQRSITNVNRLLEVLRRMLSIAIQDGWITHHPFKAGEPLISKADETRRDRVISLAEEKAMLDVCLAKGNERLAHLAPRLILAADTGMRPYEMSQLEKRDIDFDAESIHVRSFTTKTATERWVPMSERLAEVLRRKTARLHSPYDLIFDEFDVQHSFKSVAAKAGVENVRLKDFRHTFATRMADSGLNPFGLARIMGHTNIQMTLRYYSSTELNIRKANAIHREAAVAASVN